MGEYNRQTFDTGILKKSSTSLEPVPEFAESSIQRADSNLDMVESERTSTPHEEQQKFKALCEGVQNCLALFQTSLSEAHTALGRDNDVISDDENLSDPELKTISPTSPSPERRVNRTSPTRITITPDTSTANPKPASVETKIETNSKRYSAESKKVRPRIKFFGASDDEDSEEDEGKQSAVKFADAPSKSKPKTTFADTRSFKHAGVRFFQSDEEDEDEDEDIQEEQAKAPVSVPAVVKVDKGCWTHEPEFDKYLHLRIYKPDCKKAKTSFCSVAFSGQLLKTEIFEEEEEEISQEIPAEPVPPPPTTKANSKKVSQITKTDRAKTVSDKKGGKMNTSRGANSRAPSPPASRPASAEKEKKPSEFKELMFKLPNDDGCILGEPVKDITQEPLRFAVHPGKDRPMIAMATTTYGDLKILEQFEGRWSHTDGSVKPEQLVLTSVVSDRDMPFNTPCGQISMLCYLSQVERLTKVGKSTETIPFEDLVDAEIQSRKLEEEGEAIVKEKVPETPEAVYTERDMTALKEQHAEEIQLLQEEYEKRLNELARGLGPYSPDMEYTHNVVDAATSPILFRSPSLVRSPSPEQGKSPRPPSQARPQSQARKPRPRIPNLPEWGKDLPEDFLVRLHLFNENSSKYHQELTDKTRRAIQERYELQMAVQNRLSHAEEEKEDTDICLPAVFMPTRTGHVFSPKAHSYFHPPGSSEGRLTQPPSMFKLPSVPSEAVSSSKEFTEITQVSILNLFELSKRYNQAGHSWYTHDHDHDQARPHTIANPEQSQAAPPPPTACDMWSPPPYQGRARTR
ncbi:hypothetical protein pdam_00010592 [Pocillopora damicornis]|uniref:Uncharacterized protein n=1 Tax=Pocillopora damicornis TaxID=46731 RepID=A0A3M6TW32_POCDA|nr:hypothetical protein pdam_00010592 [Pocillopora damicornis]